MRTFGTMTAQLLDLVDWLLEQRVTHVALGSTGVLWKPVFNLLEGHCEVLLVNARHLKAVPGRKTDVRDAEWIADLLRHGLLRGSVVPDREQRELRELTRYRTALTRERAAGKHLWDVYIGGPDIDLYSIVAEGGFAPVQPALVLPEVLNDAGWRRGFAFGFSDNAKQYIYNYGASSGNSFSVNREFVPESELQTTDDLWNPSLRGKLIWDDPTRAGAGTNAAAVIIYRYGEDALRRLWTTQEVTFSADARQLGESTVRGRTPVAIGLNGSTLRQFQGEGVGLKVVNLSVPDFATFSPGFNSIQLPVDPPDPSVRKMFVNWFLTRDVQAAYTAGTKENSRRQDVPIVDPGRAIPDTDELFNTQSEAFGEYRSRANDLARALIGR